MKIYKPGDQLPNVSFIWPENQTDRENAENIHIEIGDNVKIRGPAVIYWGTKIGNNSILNHYIVIREHSIIGENTKIGNFTNIDGYLTIGNHVSIHAQCFIASKTIIGDHVFIGPNCTLTNTKKIKHTRSFKIKEKGPTIAYGSRIGGNSTILPEVELGREVLIGAGSVVSKNIPEFKVAFGNPAKITDNVSKDERI